MLYLDSTSNEPFYQQLYQQIVEGIHDGTYPEGSRLPSIRACARDLHVSTNTIEQAYRLAVQEDLVLTKPGSGYFVNKQPKRDHDSFVFSKEYQADIERLKAICAPATEESDVRYDFRYDNLEPDSFPYTTWARVTRNVLFSKHAPSAARYSDPQGLFSLRKQIARHLAHEDNTRAIPEQIIVLSNTRAIISTVASLFDRTTTEVCVENPGFNEVHAGFANLGMKVSSYPAFSPTSLTLPQPKDGRQLVLFITPSCQFPTTAVLNTEQRKQLLAWAEETDSYVIVDTYGQEFQTGIRRSPSLQSMDANGRIITIGSFSRSLSPSLCISYAVLPPKLMIEWIEKNRGYHAQVPWQTQAALSSYMANGFWQNHLQKLHASYSEKRKQLVRCLQTYMAGKIDVMDGNAGLHVLVRTKDGRSADELIASAAEYGIAVYPTDIYWADGTPRGWNFVLVGCSAIPLESIEPGIRLLTEAWFG
ncbi:PLP-dependent aminotransferase family protein [Slackia heliotrinireducens]|uniref:MocR-like pyridoxine biosynthesis transcription factor PdxR n=1 Tax=Slackia heliotrinireducens TaxID=84110 RepID=UPI003315AB77